ncbi:MAG: hypothetical protein QOJ06_680 [Pseudonocardiales bacterium]|jgi:hypothetical protein|nr:hypothetical protein [Pseudonocardiales bacterium]
MPASRGRAYYDTKIAEGKTGGDDAICGELSPEGAQRLLARELATRAGYS